MRAEVRAGILDEEMIVAKILQGTLMFFVIRELGIVIGSATVEILERVSGRTAHVRHLGGNLSAFMRLEDEFSEIFRGLGATTMSLTGRKGWARKLRGRGFREKFVVMEKDLGRK